MSKRVTRGWLVRAGIASAVGATAIFAAVTLGIFGSNAGSVSVTPADAATPAAPPLGHMSMSVDDTSGNIANLIATVGQNVTVRIDAGNHIDPTDGGFTGTWGGYSMQLDYGFGSSNLLSVVSTTAGGLGGCTGASWGNPQSTPTDRTVCAGQSNGPAVQSPPPTDTVVLHCNAPGVQPLHLTTTVEDSINGSTFFDENAINYPTDLTDGQVTCVLPVSKSDSTGGSTVTGSTVTYTIHVGNPGATSSFGHTVTDVVPAGVTVTGVSAPVAAAADCATNTSGNNVECDHVIVAPDSASPPGVDITITATVPDSSAGTTVCNSATLDGISTTSPADCFNVANVALGLTKTFVQCENPTTMVVSVTSCFPGDDITWNLAVSNAAGASAATGVVVTDTPGSEWTPSGATTFNAGTIAAGGSQNFTVTGTVNNPAPANQKCNNAATATSTNGVATGNSAASSAIAACKPPFNKVEFSKSTSGTDPFANGPVNLYLCKDMSSATCIANGGGNLTISEWIIPNPQTGTDPQGVGAFEFDVLYDSSLFDITVTPTNWLYLTGRWTDEAHDLDPSAGCTATIITEHDIRFGCVSKNPQPLAAANGQCLGPDNVTLVDGAVCGQNNAGIAATITVAPKSNLLFRMTPGNDNGTISTLIDSGCEVADIWGHPLSTATGAVGAPGSIGYDSLGREIPLTGIQPGGAVTACDPLTINVRLLEGDVNSDCQVDVQDDQLEASRYGSTFGSLLYDKWYDLEPALKDGDVDIKDLQKVFGRNGSNCTTPVPPQPALPQPGDP